MRTRLRRRRASRSERSEPARLRVAQRHRQRIGGVGRELQLEQRSSVRTICATCGLAAAP